MLKAIGNFLGLNNIPVYLIIIAVGIYGYLRIEALKAENDALETEYNSVVEKNNKLASDLTSFMDRVETDISDQRKINADLKRVDRENQTRMSDLQDTFNTKANGERRDLNKIAKAKPTLLERRINDGTKKVFDEIEKYSTPDSTSK